MPAPAATADEAERPYFNSRTSVAEALAAPDKCFASATERRSALNAFKAVDAISAASPNSSSPAVAKLRAPSNPPFYLLN